MTEKLQDWQKEILNRVSNISILELLDEVLILAGGADTKFSKEFAYTARLLRERINDLEENVDGG